jgi:hypothetical protein
MTRCCRRTWSSATIWRRLTPTGKRCSICNLKRFQQPGSVVIPILVGSGKCMYQSLMASPEMKLWAKISGHTISSPNSRTMCSILAIHVATSWPNQTLGR